MVIASIRLFANNAEDVIREIDRACASLAEFPADYEVSTDPGRNRILYPGSEFHYSRSVDRRATPIRLPGVIWFNLTVYADESAQSDAERRERDSTGVAGDRG